MSKTKIVFHPDAMNRLRQIPALQQQLETIAEGIAQQCGDGYVADSSMRPHRGAHAAVITATPRAIADNSKNKTMLRHIPTSS